MLFFSLTAVSGHPIPCPFQGPYFFSYTNETLEECDEPRSEIHACADKSRFIFSYRQCIHLPHQTHDIREYRFVRQLFTLLSVVVIVDMLLFHVGALYLNEQKDRHPDVQ